MTPKNLVRPLVIVILLALTLALAAGATMAGPAKSAPVEALLECTEPPAPVQLLSPANNATLNPSGIVLRWGALPDVAQYRGQMTDESTWGGYIEETTTTSTSFALPDVNYSLCLHWRVRAENSCGIGEWSATWTFCTTAQPTNTPTGGPSKTPVPPTETYTPGPPTETFTPGPPTNTFTPAPPTNTPTETLTPSITPTPTNTRTPTITPTRTNTPQGRYIYGDVRDVNGDAPLAGVTVTLYRNESGSWVQLNQKTTDSNGHYAFGFSPVGTLHRIVESDPSGYMSDHVSLPGGFAGTAVSPNIVEFEPPNEGSVGPLVFYDRRLPTSTFTATATNTLISTATPTPSVTLTPEATLTPTLTGERWRVWLPMIMNNFQR